MANTELPEHLRGIRLRAGNHEPCEAVMSIMELTAALAGEDWTSHPACASPALTDFLNHLVDRLGTHQGLAVLAPKLARSNCPECEEKRVHALVDATLRKTLPDLIERGLSATTRGAILTHVGQATESAWPSRGAAPAPYRAVTSAAEILMAALRLVPSEDARAGRVLDHVEAALTACDHWETDQEIKTRSERWHKSKR